MNAWLAPIVGDTAAPIVGFVLLFLLVILLLLIVFAILRRATGGTFVAGGRNRQVRLSVTDAAAVDNRRRLVLVRRDDVEHLILIGGPSDVVIEQNIRQFAKQPSRNETIAPPVSAPAADVKRPAAVDEPQPEPIAPIAAPEPVAPVAAPAPSRPAQTAQAAPQIPLRPAPPQQRPVAPQRDLRLAEPPKHAPAAVPVPPLPAAAGAARVATVATAVEAPSFAAPAVETPAVSEPAAENGVWPRVMRQASAPQPPAPKMESPSPAPVSERPSEPRTTTAGAFPFAVRNEPASAAPAPSTYKEPTLENVGPAETVEPDVTLGEIDFSEAFEADLESELNIAPGKDEAPRKADNIEDEMERLLGELSKPEKR